MIDTDAVVTYIQWSWPDEDLWCYDELDGERWSTRHIEIRAHDRTFLAAASLAEVLEARDSGEPGAVQAYEHRYGVVPEAPFPTSTADGEPPIGPISAEEFERLWQQGRQAREQR
ncbi:hypothetical protein FB565_008914 [Actinoplanes lutulentus]|uniref:Uncharacterized protein n=1 Tax=Actinoplanes lutulentus TaxID=1287878 RepID=A0A327Z7Y8_9ACTN|nr:hypothetical protein [Actinoplanes lutulentus]MBB2949109.1 hypothetical protein [Actinoplanes lutulentus]RAK31430.1 hypothetical protein B0I29_115237 [Actinoplanes lutulentus]